MNVEFKILLKFLDLVTGYILSTPAKIRNG